MAGSVAAHERVKSIDLLEISDGVIEASEFFKKEYNDVLNDPRLNLIVADARNYIAATNKKYDLIISEPSNPWISGISNLFTQEYFISASEKLVKEDLGRIGIHKVSDLLQTYLIGGDLLKSYVKDAKINSDDHPFIEMAGGRTALWMQEQSEMMHIGVLLFN